MAKAKSRRSAQRAGGRKAARPAGRKKTARKATRKSSRKTARKASVQSRSRARKAPARKTTRKAAARKTTTRRASARKAGGARTASARKSVPRAAARRPAAAPAAPRKVPALNRERRTVREDDIVPTPPSSLDLDRSASAARTGRRELHEKFVEHTETSPAVTGGDIDADWESASTVGDEAPGGDNPTPDQDIVDDIGTALGVTYQDNEELKGEKKVSDRDRKRWELDPASSEDYNDR